VFDGDLVTQNSDTASDCHVSVTFTNGFVAVLDMIKFFLPVDKAMTVYDGKLKFQGSTDGSTWVDYHTADGNTHTGWNYVSWDTDKPKHRYFRFSGSGASSCVINEVELHGVEAIDSAADAYSCTPKLTINGLVSDLGSAVNYQGSITPVLTSMSPRYGTVTGGTSVTFTGTDFTATPGDYTILIDKVACSVTAATTTSVTCTTGDRPGLHNSTLSI